jgi:hypothetical protein
MKTTENVQSAKPTVATGRKMMIITTQSGQTVWINENQYDPTAETVTYETKKAGDKYVKKDGTEGLLKSDRNDFIGSGRINKFAVLDYLVAKGITPSFNL